MSELPRCRCAAARETHCADLANEGAHVHLLGPDFDGHRKDRAVGALGQSSHVQDVVGVAAGALLEKRGPFGICRPTNHKQSVRTGV